MNNSYMGTSCLEPSFFASKFSSTRLAAAAYGTLAMAVLLLLAYQPAYAQTALRDAPAAGPRRPATVPDGYVITPAGYFHESCVRSLAKGERLLPDGRVQHADGTVDQDVAVCAYPRYSSAGELINSNTTGQAKSTTEATAPEISGWLEDANVTTGSSTSSYGALIAMWTVPPQPKSDDGQVLYFFPGFEVTQGVQSILQPVLGWNGGQWSIASWHCCLNGTTTHSEAVNVSPGDQIYGLIANTCTAGTLSCATWNVLTADISTGDSTTLVDTPSQGAIFNWAFGAVLEPYYIMTCDDYPSNGRVSFDMITLFNQQLEPIASTEWTRTVVTNGPPQCDYSVVQRENGHEVTLHY
jgi:hypothetical protein